MKKIICITLVAILTLCTFTGCRSRGSDTAPGTTTPSQQPSTRPSTAPSTRPSTAPTTAPTTPSTGTIMPDAEDMLPGSEDTIDPSNGANQETNRRRRHMR